MKKVLLGMAICAALLLAVPVYAQEVSDGLVWENEKLYFYEDGQMFTGGYKAVAVNGSRKYYYFQEDGSAFTGGYKEFEVGGQTYYFYFQEDGSAFTDGYKEVEIGGTTRYFYFLKNGQGYKSGYKTAEIDGKKYYFYFGSNGQAVTDEKVSVELGERNAYFLLGPDGRAYNGGLTEFEGEKYYCLGNGQTYTSGYKTVKNGDDTDYYYFGEDGCAFAGGYQEVAFGNNSFLYYFGEDGKAVINTEKDGYYFASNGRALKNEFRLDGDNRYYYGSDSQIFKGGWFESGKKYYYATAETGALLINQIHDGYKLDSTGASRTKYRIKYYANQLVDDSMSEQDKIYALFNWTVSNSWTYIRTYEHMDASWSWYDGWTDDFAADLMDNKGGNCFRYASFFGYLVKEATGLPVVICASSIGSVETPHGWTLVYQDEQWFIYDTEYAKFISPDFRVYKYPWDESHWFYNLGSETEIN